MANIKIDDATNKQLDYAVAVAQGWVLKTFGDLDNTEKSLGMGTMFIWVKGKEVLYSLHLYRPTADQAQCMSLMIESKMTSKFIDKPGFAHHEHYYCRCNGYEDRSAGIDKNLMIGACKAFLWSKHPDGMIPIME